MKKLTEIERLDLAARAHVFHRNLRYARVLMVFLSLFLLYLAVTSRASFRETFALRVLAGCAVAATISSWSRWRFTLHAWVVFFLATAFATAVLVISKYPAGLRDLNADPPEYVPCVLFVLMAYALLPAGTRFAVVYADGWEHERAQVQQWLNVLRNLEAPRETLEFSTGSFWRGYGTCRLLSTGHYWAIAKFKSDDFRCLTDFRIREPHAVQFEKQRDGKVRILITDRPA